MAPEALEIRRLQTANKHVLIFASTDSVQQFYGILWFASGLHTGSLNYPVYSLHVEHKDLMLRSFSLAFSRCSILIF